MVMVPFLIKSAEASTQGFAWSLYPEVPDELRQVK